MATADSNPSFVGESMTFRDPNPYLVRESMTARDPNPSLVLEKKKLGDSNPSPSSSVVEKTVYIGLSKTVYLGGEMDWYEVKLSSSNETRESKRKRYGKNSYPPLSTAVIEPIWKKVETPLWSCCVALGSTIYSIGGCNEMDGYYSEEVRAADLSLRQLRYVAPITATRSSPYAVTADDKIYVFGGLSGDEKGPEIEVFDPINNMWESITAPSHPLMSLGYDDGFFVTYDEASKRIICASMYKKCLLAYDTKRGSWQALDSAFDFEMMRSETGAAVFENTLYWIYILREPHAKLVVYDMDLRVSASTTIVGLERLKFLLRSPPLFHIRGNEFYLIWHDTREIGNDKGYGYQSPVLCERILVSKQVDRQKRKIRVKAKVVSTKIYLLPSLYRSMNAVVL